MLMDKERFLQHQKLFITGLVSMILGLVLLFFSLFLLPYLIWNLHYHVPYLVEVILAYFSETLQLSTVASKFYTWLVFLIPALILGLISFLISNYIDSQILEETDKDGSNQDEIMTKTESSKTPTEVRDSVVLTTEIIILMACVVGIIFLLQSLFGFTS